MINVSTREMSSVCQKQVTIRGIRCDQCELFFHPKTTTQLFCPKCINGSKPFGNQPTADHIYMNNLQNSVTSDNVKDRPRPRGNLDSVSSPKRQRFVPDNQNGAEATSNKKPRLHITGESYIYLRVHFLVLNIYRKQVLFYL